MVSPLFDSVCAAFRAQNWAFREVKGLPVIEADFEAHHAKVPLHVQVHEDANLVSVVARVGLSVPASHRLPICELLMRTNQELNLGNFELDWDAGTVLFRVTNVFTDKRTDPKMIAALTHTAVAEVDRISPFVGEILKTPKGELLFLRVKELMRREDLLPPLPEAENQR